MISFIKPGMLSTIQDMGRNLHLAEAVPQAGAMDNLSARIANKAVGNTDNAAVIEFTYGNTEFRAETNILIAYSGKGATFLVEAQELPSERPIFVPAGTRIKLKNNQEGSRSYLAIAGGWKIPTLLGSKSTYLTAGFGGFEGRAFQAGDQLTHKLQFTNLTKAVYLQLESTHINYPTWSIAGRLLMPKDDKIIRIMPGPEFMWFKENSIIDFLAEPFCLSRESNRMGYRLEGKKIGLLKKKEMLSTAVMPGTIQVAGDGSLIILMADCQTTGGYPRIAQVAAVDLPRCGQLKPGDCIYFEKISTQEAEMLYIEREKELRRITVALENRFLY